VTPFALSLKSLRNRRFTVGLTVASIALSIALLLGVERIRREAQTSFTSTISGTDLIVGARTSPVQLLLSSVFRLSDASNNMDWNSYEAIASYPGVSWTIPISLGDSYRGFRVLGTTSAYLDHLQYGKKQSLRLETGEWFSEEHGVVLGAEVANRLGHRVGDEVVVAHGAGEVSFIEHDEHPFTVTGVLAPTGTSVDRTVHVALKGIDAIHEGMEAGQHEHSHDPLAMAHGEHPVTDKGASITAFFIGLKSRTAALGVQRMVNEYRGEPLSAVMPAAALQQLWEIVGVVERLLLAVSGFVVLVGLAGMLVALMTSLNERRREMAVLRSVGARPGHVLGLVVGEAALVTLLGVVLGFLFLQLLIVIGGPTAAVRFGLFISTGLPTAWDLVLCGIVCIAGILVGLVPAYRSYRYALADGLMVRV